MRRKLLFDFRVEEFSPEDGDSRHRYEQGHGGTLRVKVCEKVMNCRPYLS